MSGKAAEVVYVQRPLAVKSERSEMLVIKACGQTWQLDMQCARSILDLQKALQQELQMEAQTFSFFDVNGAGLVSDVQLHDAIARGDTPLCATLSEASIHYIENRREELAQMQWKLMRDQMTVVNGKISALARQGNDTKAQLEQFKQESNNLVERVQKEFLWATENLQKQLDTMADTFETERASRRQDLSMHMSMIQDVKANLDNEKIAREEIKDKHAFDIRGLIEKADAFQTHITEMLKDQHAAVAKTVENVHKHFQGNVRQVNQMRSDVDKMEQDMKARFDQIEEGCEALDNRIADLSSKQSMSVERLAERHERVAQTMETLRVDQKQSKDELQVALLRTQDLSAQLEEIPAMTRELIVREREGRHDQVRQSQRILHAEQKKQLSELEEKLASRFERESEVRERSVQAMYEARGSPRVVVRSQSKPAQMEVKPNPAIADSQVHVATLGQAAASPALSIAAQQTPQVGRQASAQSFSSTITTSPSQLQLLNQAKTATASPASSPQVTPRQVHPQAAKFAPVPVQALNMNMTPSRQSQTPRSARGTPMHHVQV